MISRIIAFCTICLVAAPTWGQGLIVKVEGMLI